MLKFSREVASRRLLSPGHEDSPAFIRDSPVSRQLLHCELATNMAASKALTGLILGIDIGTTSVKVALVDSETRKVLHAASAPTKAGLPSELGPQGNEQDVHRIVTALQFCVSRSPRDLLQKISTIGISGQMHGVVLWRKADGWHRNAHGRYEADHVSVLYTWQDTRCTPEFLDTLPPSTSHLPLSTGHGCATLFWMQRNRPHVVSDYDCAGTIQDLMVCMLSGRNTTPITSVQNAASWGYFNVEKEEWDKERLQAFEFPVHLLPEVVSAGSTVGCLAADWYGIQAGVEITVALGDLQCSVYSTMEEETDAVVNISTSAQLAMLMSEDFAPPVADKAAPIQYFPYFDKRYIAVAASLNGGNVLASFVRMLQQWTHELGLGVPEDKVWTKILSLAADETDEDSDLLVVPTLFGERHNPHQRASVSNIGPLNIHLGRVTRAVCRGVIDNLHSMMPRDTLIAAGVKRIVGSGSALLRNQLLQREMETHYDIPIVYVSGGNAAAGVAYALIDLRKKQTHS